MPLGDLDPMVWGRITRAVEDTLSRRSIVDEATKKRVVWGLTIVSESGPARAPEGRPTCSLCGGAPFGSCAVHGATVADGEPALWLGEAGASAGVAGEGELATVLLCRPCAVRALDRLHDDMALARALLVARDEGATLVPAFDGVMALFPIARVTGKPCSLCRGTGAALQGAHGKIVCLGCHAAARIVMEADERRLGEIDRRNKERYEGALAAYVAELRQIAKEDARGALVTMARRRERERRISEGRSHEGQSPEGRSPERQSPEERSPEGESPEGQSPEGQSPKVPVTGLAGERLAAREAVRDELPLEVTPIAARVARAVTEKLARAGIVETAAAWWRERRPRNPLDLFDHDGGPEEALRRLRGESAKGSVAGGTGGGRTGTLEPARDKDERARQAIRFLDGEVERALRHDPNMGDLMGDRDGIHNAIVALDLEPSPPVLLQLLESVSMLRLVMATGIQFHDFSGDELIHDIVSDYATLVTRMCVGVHEHVDTAERAGLIVSGGTREQRARVAHAIHAICTWRHEWGYRLPTAHPFRYVEAEDLYAMSRDAQEEVRRQMLVTPPHVMVFGTDDIDRFVEETPRRCEVRIVTYLFLHGQQHVDLNEGLVHVGAPPPARPIPRR